jgi:hypothetical protein
MTTRQERLDAMRRELREQDEAFRRLSPVAARLGEQPIAIPRHLLEPLEPTPAVPAAPPISGVRA